MNEMFEVLDSTGRAVVVVPGWVLGEAYVGASYRVPWEGKTGRLAPGDVPVRPWGKAGKIGEGDE